LTATGGSPAPSFAWSGPNSFSATSEDLSNLAPGTYTVTATSGTCTASASYTVVAGATASTNSTSQSACDSYTWSVNGQTYTQTGSYSSVSGCTTEILNLTITSSTSNTTTQSACDSYTWSVNGQTYTASGTYSSVSGCNTEFLNLTITASSSNTSSATACDSYTWSVNGQTYTSSGSYTSTTGCHTEILSLTINPTTYNATSQSACDSYTWSATGLTYTASGSYTANSGRAPASCVVEVLNLTITPSTTNTSSASGCGSYTWSVNGQTYTTSGSYTSTSGCNTEILNLTINSATSNTSSASACDSYTWSVNGQTYSSSGSYTSVNGCSTEILNLTITASSSNTTPASACDSYNWSVNGQTYTSSGSYSSVSGCHTEILNLTITPSSTNENSVSACGSYTWNANSTTYTASGSYTSVNGCVTNVLNLTISAALASPTATVTQPVCGTPTGTITVTNPTGAGYQYNLNGGTYQSSATFSGLAAGTYNVGVKNADGCVSTTSSYTVNQAPGQPGPVTVNGPINVCYLVGTNNTATYIASSANATSFTWALPSNTTLISGQGTNTLVVKFLSGFTAQANKQLKVTPTSTCGTGSVNTLYLTATKPSTPSVITASSTNICPSLGTSATGYTTYTINKCTAADGYVWFAAQSSNVNIVHPYSGENDTVVNVTFSSAFTSSTISVYAINTCGISSTRNYSITRTNPSTPGLISGSTNVCDNVGSSAPAATFTVPSNSTVSSYIWTVPANVTIVSGGTGNSISCRFPTGFTTGSISVVAVNNCGTSGSRSLSVTAIRPQQPSVIDVINLSACPNRSYSYTVQAPQTSNTQLQWSVPAGGTIVSGQGTTSIVVTYTGGIISGSVSVIAVNNCGVSSARSVTVRLTGCSSGFAPDPSTTKSIATASAAMDMNVFPNPSSSNFTVNIKPEINSGTISNDPVLVRVLDMQGRVVKTFKATAYQTLRFGSELKSGAYMLEIRQGKSVKTSRLVKF